MEAGSRAAGSPPSSGTPRQFGSSWRAIRRLAQFKTVDWKRGHAPPVALTEWARRRTVTIQWLVLGSMRVLVTSPAGLGHIHPMLPLARALVSGGHDVLWALPEEAVDQVAAHSLDVLPIPGRGPIIRKRSSAASPN